MNKVLFSAGMIAVLTNVIFDNTQGAELATFGVGLMFAVSFNWFYEWIGL